MAALILAACAAGIFLLRVLMAMVSPFSILIIACAFIEAGRLSESDQPCASGYEWVVLFVLTGAFAALLTMHFYVTPSSKAKISD